MHLHLPKPLHGWRALFGEIGIIVVGVLIALSAEQLVQALHWRAEVRDFRQAVDHELALDLGTYRYTMSVRPCVTRRLAELETWLQRSKDGRVVPLTGSIGLPAAVSQYTSVWENKDDQVMAHLPMAVRLQYAELYDEFRNTDLVKATERDTWRGMAGYDGTEPLEHQDRILLRGLVSRAEGLNTVMIGNYGVAVRLGRKLGLTPIDDPLAPRPAADRTFCGPLIRAAHESAAARDPR